MTILITGNPLTGFTFRGPFEAAEAATDWAEEHRDDAEWWAAELEEVERS